MENKGKKLLSELKLYSDYLKWNDSEKRYETWEEAYEQIFQQHIDKYGSKITELIDEVRPLAYNKEVLASQRNLQFRGKYLFKNNARLYNCSVLYAYSPDMFNKGFFMLLSGAGLGVNLKKKYVSMLPRIYKRTESEVVKFTVPDSIEGWCEAIKVLISSYCEHPSLYAGYYGKSIKFDYSLIRPKGSLISGGYKAPGHEGLKDSLEKIELYIEKSLDTNAYIPFKSIIVYNIFMHLSNAVLSGGIRRSAMNIIFDYEDTDMLLAKTGNWRMENPHYARSNNSVGLQKGKFSKAQFLELVNLNEGDNDVGFVLQSTEDQMFNPCFEISFDFFNQIKDYNYTVIQMCNLCEIPATVSKKADGTVDSDKFLSQCKAAAILGTLQAGYTDFPYLGKETEEIVKGEALLGVSITGWMNNPNLFDAELLKEGAEVIKNTNRKVAEIIGINYAARTTTVKPSGNASVILQTPSGIHPEHAYQYFRIMQINKESEVAKWIVEHYPEMIEDSLWSATHSDYVVYVPFINDKNIITKDSLRDIEHLQMIEKVQVHWVQNGKNPEVCYNPNHDHNVSNTVLIDNKKQIVDYIYENQKNFVAVSFLARTGDKDYVQSPNTSVLTRDELFKTYGDAAFFGSGLIVDGLHCFNDNLWEACKIAENNLPLNSNRHMAILQQDWVKRFNKFSKNFFNGDKGKTTYCLKDIYLFHKWVKINRVFNELPELNKLLPKPEFTEIDTLGAIACAGGMCEI